MDVALYFLICPLHPSSTLPLLPLRLQGPEDGSLACAEDKAAKFQGILCPSTQGATYLNVLGTLVVVLESLGLCCSGALSQSQECPQITSPYGYQWGSQRH